MIRVAPFARGPQSGHTTAARTVDAYVRRDARGGSERCTALRTPFGVHVRAARCGVVPRRAAHVNDQAHFFRSCPRNSTKKKMSDLLSGDVLCLVLAYAPRYEDEKVREVCRGWCADVRRFRAMWLARGACKTVHPSVSYRVLSGVPRLQVSIPERSSSPVFRPFAFSPTSPAYDPDSPGFENPGLE